jgi:hypothetical protein
MKTPPVIARAPDGAKIYYREIFNRPGRQGAVLKQLIFLTG